LPVRILIDAYSDKLNAVGMFDGDEEANNAQTLKLLKEFNVNLTTLIKNLPGAESAPKILSPEDSEKLLATLKARFEEHNKNPNFRKLRKDMEWAFIEAKLKTEPEKMWSLNEMERTGGEPDVIRYEMKSNEYIFMDCSLKSPAGRRNICYDSKSQQVAVSYGSQPIGNVIDMAAEMGIKILNEKEYRDLQELDEFDLHSLCWLECDKSETNENEAPLGFRNAHGVGTIKDNKSCPGPGRSFRGLLRV